MRDEALPTADAGAEGAAVTSRRALLAGAGALGATAVLAACGTDPEEESGSSEPPADDPGAATGDDQAAEGDDAEEGSEGSDAEPLVAAADVAVGGGVVLADQQVVVTQPAAGEWKGFSAICTHQGCTVAEVLDGAIRCTCHDSSFSIEDGSVLGGPASRALDERPVTADGDHVYLA